MAKTAKKDIVLTPEEMLQQALVPVEEQPYKIPGNWCWVRLGSISTNQYGYTAKAISDFSQPKMLRITDIQENGVNWDNVPNCIISEEEKIKYLLNNNDIVIARTGATTGKSYYLCNPVNSVFASYLIRLRVKGSIQAHYIYQFLQSDLYWKQISDLTSGIAQPGVNSTKLQTMVFPLSPLAEQRRIVSRIESLFAKLDESKEKAQAVVDGFEDRKAAILHKAFTGELTAKWRAQNGISLDSWEKTFVGNCINLFSGQDFKPENYNSDKNGIPYITGASNFGATHVIINRWTPCPTVVAKENDVLLVCKGSGYGKTVIADFERAHIARQVMALRVKEKLLNRFLLYYLRSEYEYLRDSGQGLIPGISRKVILEMLIKLPSIPEQFTIVSILDTFFLKEDQAKTTAGQVISQIDTMKKSILARAFRGELGTNDPTDECAKELLKRIL